MGNPEKESSMNNPQVHIDCPSPMPDSQNQGILCNLPVPLTLEEKKYLLAVERGDLANVRRTLQKAFRRKHINVNCVDPFGRGALTLAIDGENLEMVELLVVMGVDTKDALLQAINAEFVEAVELLLEHEELIHKEGELYSWQKVDITTSMFTPDITPLMLAAHKNNYEILKILLDRGATLPSPHDIKCGCDECIRQTSDDSLRHSMCRVNQYRALSSPSLIALSSNDPLLTAFQLSWELRTLAFAEQECKSQYLEMRKQCQQFAVDLLDQTRTSQELAIILNHDPESPPYMDGEHMGLARLEAAIDYKQKKFVAHPNIQQLLASLWYDGVPGFRRKAAIDKALICIKVALLFPMYCVMYMIAPGCEMAQLMRKPFMKFLIHASSYLFFLFILILVSQRAEIQLVLLFGTDSMKQSMEEYIARQRGNGPTPLELLVVLYVVGFIWEETQEIFAEGIQNYLKNMWNFIDFSRNSLYVFVVALRLIAYIQQTQEINADPSAAYVPREQWYDFDPQLIAEGLFAAANVFSALKLVHLFSINPHLGPLQISLGRMVIDIVKFFFIYSLVLFAFACGLNQLLWYFADLEKSKCYSLPDGMPDWDGNGEACMKWRRFGNLFESSQSLFWASFGMVGLEAFELSGIKSYTRFWGLLMFGSYSVINVIVLLNLLIAMMSNSYAVIEEASDTEWKFARTKLWLSYFEEGGTLPPPFNIFPTVKNVQNMCGRKKRKNNITRQSTIKRRVEKEREHRYTSVMRALVWRYVAAMHRRLDDSEVTEDDINEVKNDISTMRYEMLEIFEKSGMDVSCADRKEKAVLAKRMKVWERRLMKDFHVAPVEMDLNEEEEPPQDENPLARFKRIAKKVAADTTSSKWGEVMRGVGIEAGSQIGRCRNRDSFRNQQNLQKAMKEARRFVMHSPLPQSRSVSPIQIVDPTENTLMELLKNIQAEIGDLSPGDTLTQGAVTPINQLNAQLQAILSRNPSPYTTTRPAKTKSPTVQSPYTTLMKSTSVDQANLLPPIFPQMCSPPPQLPVELVSPPRSNATSPEAKRSTKTSVSRPMSPTQEDLPAIHVTTSTLPKPKTEPLTSTSDAPKVVKRKAPAPSTSDITVSRPAAKPVAPGQGMIPPPPSKAVDETPILNIPTISTIPATPLVDRKVASPPPVIKKDSAPEPPKMEVATVETIEPPQCEIGSPKTVIGLGVEAKASSSSKEQLISSPEEQGEKLVTGSPTCLRPYRKVEDVTTVKRQPKSGWL